MRRLMMLGMLPVLGGLLWIGSCARDNWRDVLPLRPFEDAASPAADMATAADLARPADMAIQPDMASTADLAPPADLVPPEDLTTPADLTATDM